MMSVICQWDTGISCFLYTKKQTDIGPTLLLNQTSSRGFQIAIRMAISSSTRRLVEIFYQTSSSRKKATYQTSTRRSKYLLNVHQQKNSSIRRPVEFLLDVQQNFYQTSSRPDDLGHYQRQRNYLSQKIPGKYKNIFPWKNACQIVRSEARWLISEKIILFWEQKHVRGAN